MELFVQKISDVVFKYTWVIKRYSKVVLTQEVFDSPPFEVNINGMHTKWGLSIRFWKGADGHRLLNPIVLCLNQISRNISSHILTDCDSTDSSSSSEGPPKQKIYLNFQFGLYNNSIGREDTISVTSCSLPEETTQDLISVGFQEVSVKKRHLSSDGSIRITVKMQMYSSEEKEKHTLSNDMNKMMEEIQCAGNKFVDSSLPDIVILTAQGEDFPVHRNIMACRSKVFADLFESPVGTNGHSVHKSSEGESYVGNIHKFDMDDISKECLRELISYAYTDHVKGLETHANALLAAAERYGLPGLKTICAQSLANTIEPGNVANLLLLADRCHCQALKQEALSYCEGHAERIGKNLAWKVMEVISPQLFQEACEVGIGDSNSSNLDSLHSCETEAL
ncbi:TD and POZ domain-containing protein 2-like [Ischnura elegans]|uniref:TD and POZ domain-containing protein 2-like n=1 Tax=Ischnura elegans TaxID=197161 RepID=UPI001ED8A305|nr:TD and POZ domain-containing protein 2-like [Ischnura elegans]XP_046406186.1 TD and POZ domain-containing protein 2-like [Ischnura elegans]